MGNEFGHPEWIDFPREGNNWSYKYARRQWSLADNKELKFEYLGNFDREMISLLKTYNVLGALDLRSLWVDEPSKLIAFKKANLIFLFNFNPTESFPEYELPTGEGQGGSKKSSHYEVIFTSDDEQFGGYSRIDKKYIYETTILKGKDGQTGITIYSPSRTALVLKRV
jgi:1,4-alpha-glucan branching enzyme